MNVMTIFIGIVILFLAGMCFVNAFKLKKMRDRCTEKVKATCIEIDTKAVDFSIKKRHSRNATYMFSYNGRHYIGSNSVWTSAGLSDMYVKKNKDLDIFINPRNPEYDIFDPFARREMFNNIRVGVYFLIALIPLSFPSIIFHFLISN